MRNLVVSLAAILAIAWVAACGASSKEVAAAKSARYQGDKLQLFAETKVAVEEKYQLTKSDETTLGMQTEARWYSFEGLAQTPRGDDMRDVRDKSIRIALVVKMLPDGDAWVVKVDPVMARYNQGMPNLEPIRENDASLPGWVQGKVDEMSLAIHKRLAKYEVKTLPSSSGPPPAVPTPDEPTQPAPGDGTGTPAGSAAGSATP